MAKSRWWKDKDGYDSVWLDPDDAEDFGINFTPYLTNETIDSYTVSTDGVTIANVTNDGYKVNFMASEPTYPYGTAVVQITTTSSPAKVRSRTCRFYQREM